MVFHARGIDASGRHFDAPEVAIYDVRDGKIVRSQMFHADAAAVSEFLSRGRTGRASAGSEGTGNA